MTQTPGGPYILYAEDDRDDQEMLREELRDVDPTVNLVLMNDGLALIQFLSGLQRHEPLPFLILLDINMPIWDGIRTLEALKEDQHWASIPVVMFTTSSQQKDVELSLRLGADSLVTKPVSKKDLTHIVQTFCNYRPSERGENETP